MVFQNVPAHVTSDMVVSITNKGKRSQLVKVSMASSPYFQLDCPNDVCHIVPAGMSTPVRVLFTPKENKDYSHELVCMSGSEWIVVPIRAIAARAILDFPDQLDFPVCPVKCSTQKTLLVRNVGNRAARYQLSTQSPFSVVPATGILGVGDTMQVTVGFHPLTAGDHSGSLVVGCTGEESIHINLQGKAEDVNIELNTNLVKVEKTSVNMSNHTTMFIKNNSNITAHFQWKAFPTEEHENEEKRRQCSLLQPSAKVWLEAYRKDKKMEKEKGFCENRALLLSNKYEQDKAKVQADPMLFSNDIFFIEPMEGEIGPHCLAEIKVTFKPTEPREYRCMAYCNISGRESRLPLCLRGEGQGPLVELCSDTLNLGSISVNTPHNCEVKLINQGAIDAPFTYIPSTTHVGSCFKFAPEEGIIAPGEIQTIQISFNATVVGCFEEQFQFSVAGSPTPVILTIKGRVTGPTLHFDVDELDFGDISFGFPFTKTCRLTNTSPEPLTFKLRVSDDGTQPAVSSFDQIRSDSDPSWRKGIHFVVEPREFTMNPSQGTILPQGHQDIEVTLCSNTVMEFCRKLLVDLEEIGEGVASLIMQARCFVPKLQVYPPILCIDDCRLKVPFERTLFITNNTHLPGCYGLIPQKRKEDSPVFYSSPKPCGIVQPHSTAEIPLVVKVQTLGKHRTRVRIGVFGDERNPLGIQLQSYGKLSEIYPSPRLIEFGMIPVLQPNSQSFTLFNEGFLPRGFRMEIACKPHCYVIEPREGVIPARGAVPVTVTATLDDTGVFDDAIRLFIGNSLGSTFMLQALGTGTTIVIDKPFTPELNLGYQFSLLPCIRRFKLTNGGHHFHRLFWKVECNSPAEEEGQSTSALSSPKAKDDSQSPKRPCPVFGLEPPLMDLQPGESVDMVLQGFSPVPQVVRDYVRCEAVIGTGSVMKKIIETIITCEFIDPSIEVSARQFSFRAEKKPSDVLTLHYQPLTIKNTCSLPLDLMLSLERPFHVCHANQQPLPDGQPVTVDVKQTCHLYIAFDPAYKLDFHSWKVKKVLKIEMVRGHPSVEQITLWGEVHFPNLQIQPSTLEFGCVMAGTREVRSLEMTNCSSFPVKYHWAFQTDSQANGLTYELHPLKFKPEPPKGMSIYVDHPATQWRRFKMRTVEEPATTPEESRDLAQSPGAEVPPHTREKRYIPPGLRQFRYSMDLPHKVVKAFSILPLSGVLQPGERQQVSLTFSGRLNTIAGVRALCCVEGGPTYKVELTGGGSRVSYSLSPRKIDCGLQLKAHRYFQPLALSVLLCVTPLLHIFNEIHHSTVTLENTCNVKFNWVINPSTADRHLPGVFLVNPVIGSLAPGKKQVLNFSYMPVLPGAFSRTYQLKVGDLNPESISLKGEAFFPMITVNLPWNINGSEKYEEPPKQLGIQQQYTQRNKSVVGKNTESPNTETLKSQTLMTPTLKIQAPATQTPKTLTMTTQNLKTQNQKPCLLGSGIVPDNQVQVEMVKMLMEKAALELQQKLTSHLPKNRFPDKQLCQSLLK
ncbi:hydrocephalus-inducing protein-like [Hirundo rustica]|uniref:hydrocephalus-inducing protein-like n=1 Tax=Hirundo rustica TaxID=43150 RepID=UPI0026731163|nr:hydrocephalus-inducing protein-like [Hirundo rustica]